MITVHDLHLQRGTRMVVRGLTMRLEPGQICALLGPNGSGKSTLLLALAGLLQPERGVIEVGRRRPSRMAPRERARLVSLLPQRDETVFTGTLGEFLTLACYDNDAAAGAIESVIARLGLTELKQRILGELSGGEYQRALIALVMLQHTPVILLDEPLRNLDLKHRAALVDWLKARARAGALIVVALHELEWLPRFCDSACLLYDHDNPLSGRLDDVYTRENLERLMQCSFVELTLHERRILLPQ